MLLFLANKYQSCLSVLRRSPALCVSYSSYIRGSECHLPSQPSSHTENVHKTRLCQSNMHTTVFKEKASREKRAQPPFLEKIVVAAAATSVPNITEKLFQWQHPTCNFRVGPLHPAASLPSWVASKADATASYLLMNLFYAELVYVTGN